MITVTVKSLTPDGAVGRADSAESIERALEAAGGDGTGAAVVFPIDGAAFYGRGEPAAAADVGDARRATPALMRARVRPRGASTGSTSEAVAAP